MMDISLQLDKNSSIPLYQQIYRQLRPLILNGALPAGSRLPATRRLAAVHSIARVTVLQAYEQLEVEGFVEGRTGAGTYVAHNLPVNGRRWPLPHEQELFQPALSHWGSQLTVKLPLPKQHHANCKIDFTSKRSCGTGFPTDLWRRTLSRAISSNDNMLSHRGAVAGYKPLREAIASYLTQQRGVNCDPEQVVVVSGVPQALDILARLLLQQGDEVLVETPGNRAIHHLFRVHGAQLHSLPVAASNEMATVLADSQSRLAVVTPSHRLSDGEALLLPERLALLAWAKRQQALIIEDDTDGDLRYGGRPLMALQGLDKEGHVVYMGDLSAMMFPALRLGYVVLPLSLKRPFIQAKRLLDGSSPLLNQVAMADFMNEGHFDAHLRQLRRVYHERWRVLTTALHQQLGDTVHFSSVAAGTKLLVYLPEGVDERAVVRETAVCGVNLTPGTPCHLQKPVHPSILLSFSGLTEAEIEEGVKRITSVLLSTPQKQAW